MNLFHKIGNAIEAFQGKSFDPTGFTTGEDISDSGKGAKLTSPYAQSSWVYIAVSILAKSLAAIPFRISRVPATAAKVFESGRSSVAFKKRVLGENLVEAGAVVDLFAQPHPTMDGSLFFQTLMTWHGLRGEFFILPLDKNDATVDLTALRPRIATLITLSPDLFWHRVMGYVLEAWRYTGSPLLTPIPSQYFLPEELVYSRTPNPYLYWRGLPPLTLAMLAAASDYAASQFMKGLMMNNADTGLIVTSDQWPSDEQREQLLAALRARKRQAGTADRPMIMGGGYKVEKPAVSSADAQFLENRKINRQEIGAIFGIPSSIMGVADAQKASIGAGGGMQEQDRLTFYQTTMSHHTTNVEKALRPIVKSFGPDLIGWFDVDSLPIMQEARRARLDSGAKAFAMGVPFNDINQVYDLGFRELPWGDTGMLPFNLQPAGQSSPPEIPSDDDDQEEASANPFARAAVFFKTLGAKPAPHVCSSPPAYEQSIAGSIKLKRGKLGKFFFQQRGRVLAKLGQEYGAASASAENRALDSIFDLAGEGLKLLGVMKPMQVSDLEFGGSQVYDEINLGAFQLPPAEAVAFLAKRKNVITTISDNLWESELKPSLKEGITAGESIKDLNARVAEVYNRYTSEGANTLRVAMTETNVAVNTGRDVAMHNAGIEKKGWLTSHQENSRETHVENERITEDEGGIGIDEDWPNGCAYPGDPDGDADEVINCRCVGIAMEPASEDNFRPQKFLSYETFMARKETKI